MQTTIAGQSVDTIAEARRQGAARQYESAALFLTVVDQRDHLKAALHEANMALSTMGKDLTVAKAQAEAFYSVAVEVIDSCPTCKRSPASCIAAHRLAKAAMTTLEAFGVGR